MERQFLAVPGYYFSDNVRAYLYGGAELVESNPLGTIIEGPGEGGFSMAVTRDRLASGLIFGQVFDTYGEALGHLKAMNRRVQF